MRRVTMIAALFALAACGRGEANGEALPAIPAVTGDAPASQACALQVMFGSYAMGIDRGTLEKVEALLASDAAVLSVDRQHWGREGEMTLCAQIRSPGDAKRLFYAIKPLFPAKPRGPLTLTTATGMRFQAG